MKVEEVKRPLLKGEKFLVPCLIKKNVEIMDEQEIWMDLTTKKHKTTLHILPVINHPHSDMENGQKEIHYHLDYRFIKHKNDREFPTIKNTHSSHIFGSEIRPKKDFGDLTYFLLPVINEDFKGITPVSFIKKSKLKHKCIHKGKCPHRGYDLSQVTPDKNGVKTCPLHGLKFDKNGKIINK
jgi:hypothetical protein